MKKNDEVKKHIHKENQKSSKINEGKKISQIEIEEYIYVSWVIILQR